MPTDAPLSAASRLVLDELDGAGGKAVMKLAIKELVALGDVELVSGERRRRFGRPRPKLLLVPVRRGDGDAVLTWMAGAIRAAPSELEGTRVAHELSAVAESIAKDDAKAERTVVRSVLADLERRGLVGSAERRVLGVVRRTVWKRTPEGDALSAAPPDRQRRRDRTGGGGHAGYVEGGQEERVDASLDASFDSAFDSSFDSSFDSGFSDGGGDGGGGGGGD